jgi:outer membrane protein
MRNITATVGVLLLAINLANAQNTSPLIGLKELIQRSINHSPKVKQAQLDRTEIDEVIAQNIGRVMPQATASTDLKYYPLIPNVLIPNFTNPTSTEKIPVQFGTRFNLSAGADVNQILYNKPLFENLRNRPIVRELRDLMIDKTKEETIWDVANNYYQVLQNIQQLNLIEANEQKLQQLLNLANIQQKGDLITKTEVNRIEIALTNLTIQKQTLADGIEFQLNVLKYYAGIPLQDPINIDTTNTTLNTLQDEILSWVGQSLKIEQSLEYKLLDRQMYLKTKEIEIAKAENYPALYFFGHLSANAQRDNFADIFTEKWFGTGFIGIKAEAPIFNGFQARHKAQAAQIRLERAKQDEQMLREGRNLEFTNARKKLLSSWANIQTQQKNITLANAVYQRTYSLYKEGMAPLSDILNAQSAIREAEIILSQQIFAAKSAQLTLIKSLGRLDELTQ